MARKLTKTKAGKMLKHGTVRGKPLTGPQEGYFGLVKGGGTPTRLRKNKKRRR